MAGSIVSSYGDASLSRRARERIDWQIDEPIAEYNARVTSNKIRRE